MALIYVTGSPGTGKTTIQKELLKHGYTAHDIDQPRFGGPVNLITGEKAIIPPVENRKPEWFKQHEWRVSRPSIERLKISAKDTNVYLCGTTSTEHLVWDLFDKILYLNIDEEILRNRVLNRIDNDYGRGDGELDDILRRYRNAQEKLPTLGVTIIDANGSIEETFQAVIAATQS